LGALAAARLIARVSGAPVAPPSLFASGPGPWTVDATCARVSEPEIDALPWPVAFAEMAQVEAGAHVNTDEDRAVGHFWLRSPERAPTIEWATAISEAEGSVRAFAEAVRSGAQRAPSGAPFEAVLHLGIGGSALGAQLVVDALGGGGLELHTLDNVDPDGFARVLGRVAGRLDRCLVTVASKSGGTAETRHALSFVRARFEAAGHRFGAHAVALTTAGSALDRVAVDERWLARFEMWDAIGGRFSVTSAVGLLPAALAGVDVAAFLAGAAEMDDWTRAADWRANPAALLAGAWHVAGRGRGDRSLAILPYRDRLVLLGRYLQQLLMESLGKRTDRAGREVVQGLTVYGNKGSTDQHAFVQQLRDGRDDALTMFVQVLDDGGGEAFVVGPDDATTGDWLQGFLLGTRRALAERGRPSITVTLDRLGARELGGLIALFERAVGLYAGLVGVNAYDQPGVEAGKRAAADILALATRVRGLLNTSPTVADLLKATGADPIELRYLLGRLERTGRARFDGRRWRAP
jgi:glucose-6-phosphate isomerase